MNIDEFRERELEHQERFGNLPPDALWKTVEAFLQYKLERNRRPEYLRTLKSYLRRFIKGNEHQPITIVDDAMIQRWFQGRNDTPAAMGAGMGRLSSWLTWAVRRKLIEANPIRQLERPVVEHRPPKILAPAEVRRLCNAARRRHPEWLAYIVLGTYAGIRPAELTRLNWSHIDLKRGHVVVDAAASKVRLRRIVPLHPKAVALLRRCDMKPEDKISPRTRSTHVTQQLTRAAKIQWSHDIMRHTAASYLLALHQDAGRVSKWLGNSVTILLNHYQELVSNEDCRRFWKYRFEAMASNTVPLPSQSPHSTPMSVLPTTVYVDCSMTATA